jgi:hypothetical protein
MVTRKWLRAGLFALVLYIVAGAVIGYFGLNAYSAIAACGRSWTLMSRLHS